MIGARLKIDIFRGLASKQMEAWGFSLGAMNTNKRCYLQTMLSSQRAGCLRGCDHHAVFVA